MAADAAGYAADAGAVVEGSERVCAKTRDLPRLARVESELRGTEATYADEWTAARGESNKRKRCVREPPQFHRAERPGPIRSLERGARRE